MKRTFLRTRPGWLIMTAGAFIPLLASTPVRAATPTIQVQEQGYNASRNEVTISVSSNGLITLPGGNKHNQTATMVVNKNGVYSFQAEINGTIVTDSIHVTKINSEKLRTNDPQIKLNLSYKDELSAISHVRMKNEASGSWSSWQSTASVSNNRTETRNWTLNTSQEGDRTVFVQVRDRAGNVTPGQAYDQIVYDVTGPTFSIARDHYYVRDNSFKLHINDLQDTYSPVAKVTIQVGNQAPQSYGMTTAFIRDMENGLDVVVPKAERDRPGEKTIRVTAEDDLGNVSETKTLTIYHDNVAPNKGDIELRTEDNKEVKAFEGGRQWDGTRYVYFQKEDGIRLVDDKNIYLNLNVGDADSGVRPDTLRAGHASVEVIEYNIQTDADRNILESERRVVRRHTYRGEIQADGSLFVPWELSYGLEKQIAIVVTDNAGNSRKFYDDPIYMSSLNMIHFKVSDVVNPAVDWKDVSYVFGDEEKAPAEMMAGANVDYDIAFSLLTAEPAKLIFGSMEIKTVHDELGYVNTQTIPLENAHIKTNRAFPYWADSFVIPDNAPNGSKVYATGWIKAEMEDGTELRVYFPSKELSGDPDANRDKEIGIIMGNLHQDLQFRSIQPDFAD